MSEELEKRLVKLYKENNFDEVHNLYLKNKGEVKKLLTTLNDNNKSLIMNILEKTSGYMENDHEKNTLVFYDEEFTHSLTSEQACQLLSSRLVYENLNLEKLFPQVNLLIRVSRLNTLDLLCFVEKLVFQTLPKVFQLRIRYFILETVPKLTKSMENSLFYGNKLWGKERGSTPNDLLISDEEYERSEKNASLQ